MTALLWAADKGHTSVVTLLLDAQAEIDLADEARKCKACPLSDCK